MDGQPLAETPSFAESTSSLDSTPSTDTTRTIGLAEAIQLALASNLDLALSRAQHEVAEARSSMASKALLPTFEVGGGVTRTDGMVQGAFGDFRDVDARGVTGGLAAGLRLNIGARVYEAMAARRDEDAALLDSLNAQQQLVLRVVELYENLVLSKVALDINQQLVESSQEFEHIASVRHEGGIGLGADVARAQANLAASRQQLVQSENLWRTTSVRLAVVLRFEPSVLLVPAETALEPWQLPPAATESAYPDLATQRPDVESLRTRAEAAEQLVRARWWDLVAPELNVEWRLSGIGGEGHKASPETGPAVSSAAGSAGRSVAAWQNAADALATPGANTFAALSSAAGSGGRSFYAYRNLFGSTRQEEDFERQERYGIWLNWSLSFAKFDRIREQRATAEIAGLRADRAEEAAIAEVHQAQYDIQSAMQALALANDEVAASETSHRLSRARFTAGTAIAFEVLDAQDALADARLKVARYSADLNLAQARLLTAAGLIDGNFHPTGP
ncbi:MAG: TolC family protein [Candidatus Hydrogenedentes bacterium]|nr:TolC family protein [Candidatus Hydrogenedentota bacterium]